MRAFPALAPSFSENLHFLPPFADHREEVLAPGADTCSTLLWPRALLPSWWVSMAL